MSSATVAPSDPAQAALRLAAQAREAKREAQRLQREAARTLAELEQLCKKHGIDFRLIRQQERTGEVDERQGHPRPPSGH